MKELAEVVEARVMGLEALVTVAQTEPKAIEVRVVELDAAVTMAKADAAMVAKEILKCFRASSKYG